MKTIITKIQRLTDFEFSMLSDEEKRKSLNFRVSIVAVTSTELEEIFKWCDESLLDLYYPVLDKGTDVNTMNTLPFGKREFLHSGSIRFLSSEDRDLFLLKWQKS